MESMMVIKVKYGDTLRRFSACVNENGELGIDIIGLRAKIHSLFNFPPESDPCLTYIDEDGDVVTLVDDNDLHDVMRQRLKFLRIDVKVKSYKHGKPYARSSGNSTPLRTPRSHPELPKLNTGVAKVLKSVPEPFREAISKLSLDIASKAAYSDCTVADLLGICSKMGQSLLSPVSQFPDPESNSQSRAAGNLAPSVIVEPTPPNDCRVRDVLLKFNAAIKTTKAQDIGNASEGVTAPVAPLDLNLDPVAHHAFTNVLMPPPCGVNSIKSSCSRIDSLKGVCVTAPVAPLDLNLDPVAHHAFTNVLMPPPCGVNSIKSSCSRIDSLKGVCVTAPVAPLDLNLDTVAHHAFTNVPMPPPCGVNSIKSSCSRIDSLKGVCHSGICCDGCDVYPIVGPRYKSEVKDDYDLCNICFSKMGNEQDYIKIDRPLSYRQSRIIRAHDHLPSAASASALPHHVKSCQKAIHRNLDSCFIMDVSVWDDTIMAPSTPFTKIWRMQNNGSIPWPQGARLVWTGGDKFSDSVVAEIQVPADGVPVSEVLDIAVDFTAPVVPGQYISYWRMESPTCVKFGPQVWVLIQVDNSLNESLCEGFEGLNLNLPPTNDDFGAPKSIDVSVKPEVDDAFVLGTRIANTGTTELVKPMAVEQPKRDQQLNFTINDSMLVGNAISASSPASSSVPYPVIDLPDATPSSEVEQSLLKELEEMGFKQVDLNKEILRMNEYDLQRSLDDLCGDAEWDPILEELMAMGFNDAETNKRLLKKNNGSIKGVVMDLFAQEKP